MAVVAHTGHVDPTRPGKYPIIIAEELLRQETPRKRQRIAVRYNHKPKSLNGQPATINPLKIGQENIYKLSIRSEDEGGSYKYNGSQKTSDSLALIYDPEKQAFVLDKIDAELSFNLQSTPSEKNAALRYPELGQRESGHRADDLFGDDQEDENPDDRPPDPNNPYDYRHYLHINVGQSPQPSLQGSPFPSHIFNSSPLLKPTSPAPRPRAHTVPKKPPRQRRSHLSPHPSTEAPAQDESDPNELVIDMGDSEPVTNKPWRAALGALNERGRPSGRPISLRSAASSMSPSVRARSDSDSEDDEDKRDNDVEEIDLGSPQVEDQGHRASKENTQVNGDGWDDEDGDIFQTELGQALEEQEAENGQLNQPNSYASARPVESSSESEEE